MDHLQSKMGWEIVEEEWPDFKGKIYAQRPFSLNEMLEKTVAAYPETVGFLSDERRLTFAAFDEMSDRIAAAFQDRGVGKGDRVAMLLGIGVEFPLTFFALMKIGAIAVPLNTRFKGEELAYEIDDSESKILVVDAEYWASIEPVLSDLKSVESVFYNGPDVPAGVLSFEELREFTSRDFIKATPRETDDAVIVYTSGTTGKPKGAILHHRGMVASAMHISDFHQFDRTDKTLCCVPLFHVTGLAMIMLSHIYAGIPCFYMRTFSTKRFLETMSGEKITKIISVINIIWLMVNHPDFPNYDFSHYKASMCGGSPATTEMISGIMRKLPHLRISVGYGLTESTGAETSTPWEDALRKIEGVGKPFETVDAKIVNENGEELPANGVGEILLRSPKVMKGYWKKPEATRATIRDGWLYTGDIGKLDEEGFLYILDRKKDMINRGGEKVYSLEVENVISTYDKVLEVSVVSVPDKIMGEAVKAAVVLMPGQQSTEEEIRSHCSAHLADYKVPKYVEFMEALPRNPAGKVVKNDLRYIPKS